MTTMASKEKINANFKEFNVLSTSKNYFHAIFTSNR